MNSTQILINFIDLINHEARIFMTNRVRFFSLLRLPYICKINTLHMQNFYVNTRYLYLL